LAVQPRALHQHAQHLHGSRGDAGAGAEKGGHTCLPQRLLILQQLSLRKELKKSWWLY
jgi:hypothetical protein